jgi:hypothetical protein
MPPPWSARWAADAERHGFWPIPDSLLDETDAWQATARRAEIAQINRSQADALRSLVP